MCSEHVCNSLALNELRHMTGYTLGVSEHVGKEIAKRRSAKGWTQVDLSEATGLSGATISRIERGERTPHKNTLKTIEAALGEATNERPRPAKGSGRDTRLGEESGGVGIENRLGDLLAYIGSLEGKAKTDFIRAVVALLTALEHTRPAARGGGAQDDGR